MTVGRRIAKASRKGSGPAPANQPRIQALTALLVHDVGKYLARTARNLPPAGPLDPVLIDMLCRDLYGDRGGVRPAVRFAELAGQLLPLIPDAPLPAIGSKLAELAGLEVAVRAGQPIAVGRAAALALEVEQRLRALATWWQRLPKPLAE